MARPPVSFVTARLGSRPTSAQSAQRANSGLRREESNG
jgi:hypothetical protein